MRYIFISHVVWVLIENSLLGANPFNAMNWLLYFYYYDIGVCMLTNTLTVEEQNKEYSKYFYQEMAKPNEELKRIINAGLMSADDALLPEDINKLLEPGYQSVETGYCLLNNGAGYLACNNQFPNVNIDMINWWFAWHSFEPLRYKLWNPKCHFDIAIDDAAKKDILSSDVQIRDKFINRTHEVIEDIGFGPEKIKIQFLSPEQMGFLPGNLQGRDDIAIIGGNGFSKPISAPIEQPPAPAIMLHFFRKTQNGIESRTRFWLGYSFINNKPVKLIPEHIKIPTQAIKALAIHNIEEYSNLAAILPNLYREQNGMF